MVADVDVADPCLPAVNAHTLPPSSSASVSTSTVGEIDVPKIPDVITDLCASIRTDLTVLSGAQDDVWRCGADEGCASQIEVLY